MLADLAQIATVLIDITDAAKQWVRPYSKLTLVHIELQCIILQSLYMYRIQHHPTLSLDVTTISKSQTLQTTLESIIFFNFYRHLQL